MIANLISPNNQFGVELNIFVIFKQTKLHYEQLQSYCGIIFSFCVIVIVIVLFYLNAIARYNYILKNNNSSLQLYISYNQ